MRICNLKIRSRIVLCVGVAAILASCAGGETTQTRSGGPLIGDDGQPFPPPPPTPTGSVSASTQRGVDQLIEVLRTRSEIDHNGVEIIAESGDPRLLWILNDLLRFSRQEDLEVLMAAFETLTATTLPRRNLNEMANRLIAWDLPAPPGYSAVKRSIYTIIEPKWEPFFDGDSSDIDWRPVAWGGVWIDDRLDGSPGQQCYRCIPALDDPPVTDATGGSWYDDERLIFGVVINGEARAYPKNIMQIHEMINDTLGERRIGMPYCTLCGSAQAYYTDDVDGFAPVLRTSGLLTRSNKIMYDLTTMSVIDTFSGKAVTGPLRESGVVLGQASVVTSTWGDWKRDHPETTIIAEDGGVPGNIYPLDPLGGRDDSGPIFPVGDVDPRLEIQELVLGVVAADDTPVAFPVVNAVVALRAGDSVALHGIRVELDGSGLRAFIDDIDAGGHEAFWFAWSQFMPATLIWQR